MLDYTFIDTIVVRVNFMSKEDSEIIDSLARALDNYGLPVEIREVRNGKDKISYRIRTTFAKYKPSEYNGNDSTNIHPAPLRVYKAFFAGLLAMCNELQDRNYTDDEMFYIEKIDITKQTLISNDLEEWLYGLVQLKLRGGYRSARQNSCYYVFYPQISNDRMSKYREVFKVYDKVKEMKDTKAIESPLYLKYVPSEYSISRFMDIYNPDNNSLNIEDLKMLRAEISLKDRQVEKLVEFLGTNKFCSVKFLYESIINRTFYNILNNFFSNYLKNRFYLPALIRQNNKPLKVFQRCYTEIKNPILKSHIREKALISELTKEIVLNNTDLGYEIIDKLMNDYEPPI